jgi:hypothetical protein
MPVAFDWSWSDLGKNEHQAELHASLDAQRSVSSHPDDDLRLALFGVVGRFSIHLVSVHEQN